MSGEAKFSGSAVKIGSRFVLYLTRSIHHFLRKGEVIMKRLFIHLCILLVSVTLAAGVRYTAKQTITGEKGQPVVMKTRVEYSPPPRVRVEFLDASNPVMKQGTYMVSRDGKTE